MKIQQAAMADGRELYYFDEHDDAVRPALDRRELPERPAASELRLDPLTEEWVAIAGHRQTRTFLPPSSQCPLCPSTADNLSEIPAGDYDVVIFENRFPAFANPGRCEVVCFTADHESSFSALPEQRVRTVLAALATRTRELSALPGVEQVFCFENRGTEIGVTLHHPHGQIYGYPYVTPRTARMLEVAKRHRARTGRVPYAELLEAEQAGPRVIDANEHWTAFVPRAARWPYEIHIAPHRQVPDLAALTDAERDACAPLWLSVLRRLDRLFDLPMPYIAAWHQAPVRADRELGYLHLQIFSTRRAPGKLKYLAGSESAMGAFISDVTPEQAAQALRDTDL